MSKTLFLSDFDWSMLDTDSDTWIFENLRPDLSKELETMWHSKEWNWVDLMDNLLLKLQKELPEDEDCIKSIQGVLQAAPLHPTMKQLLKNLHAANTDIVIMSDANIFYIEEILKHHDLLQCIKAIYTNKIELQQNSGRQVMRIRRFTTEPHGCKNGCSANLCKGKLVDDFYNLADYDNVLYLGDGRNDYCPSTRLPATGLVLARNGRALAKHLATNPIQAKVHVWNEAPDMASLVLEHLNQE
jgi:pyridoxal phosphate phosphatase PHOSPHO2